MKLSHELIQNITGSGIRGSSDHLIEKVAIDSRKVRQGKGVLFFALRGTRNDGHAYLADLYKKGVRNFVVEELPSMDHFQECCFFQVDSSLRALHELSGYYRSRFASPVIGITGSNGKTIIKEWLFQSLDLHKKVTRSPESYNSQVGVPLSLFLLEDDYDRAIIEAGISKPGEMERLERIIRPDWGIFSNIGDAHQENFSSLTQKASEKLKLFSNVSRLIYCHDHEVVHQAVSSLPPGVERIAWGMEGDPKYRIDTGIGPDRRLQVIGDTMSYRFELPFIDPASVENLCHVIVCLLEEGLNEREIQNSLNHLEPVAMRQEMLQGIRDCILISDTYNSDINSLSNALDYLNLQHQGKKRSLILSDILQSNRNSEELYASVAKLVKEKGIERFMGIGPDLLSARRYFPEDSAFYPDTETFLNSFDKIRFEDEAILIKGSRHFQFERISSRLQAQSHRTSLEIDFNSMVENLNYFRSLLKPGVRLMAMVKAFSYGSGGYEIASVLQYHNVDYLAVAFADEGVELRRSGIEMPVMVINPEISDFDLITRFNLEPELYNFRILKEFSHYLKVNAMSGYPVHIKLDTGMHRLGFSPSEVIDLTSFLKEGILEPVSVFTHLAASDEEEQDEYTRSQAQRFTVFCNELENRIGRTFYRHILNSSGIQRFPEFQFNMVRLGIGLYGIGYGNESVLTEVSTFKTRISQIREVSPGETIGYSRAGKINRPSVIATVPAGYADGIPRSLSQGVGKFMINHHLAPVIGNVCMDMTMVDVTGIPAEEGDEVVIFGPQHSVRKLAEMAGTIPYEMLTSVSRRVKRIYIQE